LKFLSADAVAAASPPGILSGISAVAANSDVGFSLRALCDDFSGSVERGVFVARAATYASMQSANFPRVGIRDGVLLGAPALVSSFAPESSLLLIDPLHIGLAMDAITVTAAREGSIEMDSAPSQVAEADSSPASTGSNLVSLFQTNALALRADVFCNWSVSSGAVAWLDTSAWSGGSP
jgi:hypothetical protein